jgi:acetyltransferase-like isoleucine patch superfamily enzyme
LVARNNRKTIAHLQARLKLWRCDSVGPQPTVLGRVWIHGEGRVRIGARVRIDGRVAPIELHAHPGAEISLGDDVVLESGASIEAQTRITIGDRVRLGRFSTVMDNHFHHLEGDRLRPTPDYSLVIEDDVVVGERSIVLQGAHLEAGAHVAKAAVASRRVLAYQTYPRRRAGQGLSRSLP